MTESERIAQADRDRTALQFVSFLNGAFGPDQSYANQDNGAVNYPNQFETVSPYGVSREGLPISNRQPAQISSGALLLIALGVAFFVLNK